MTILLFQIVCLSFRPAAFGPIFTGAECSGTFFVLRWRGDIPGFLEPGPDMGFRT